MARIPSGIMGGIKGKLGGVVGASWKGINYLKAYVIPANPQSTGQQTQRSKMQLCVYVGKLILSAVVQPFWNPFAVKMSGIHYFTSTNLARVASATDYANLLATKGTLEVPGSPGELFGHYDASGGQLALHWGTGTTGNGLATDLMGFAAIDTANDVAFTDIGNVARSVGERYLSIGSGRDFDDIEIYAFCYRGTVPDMVVSDSLYKHCSEAP